ncbi:hypothetical protein [Sphingomonas sp. SRS2]|uniref:hypothetical protein n=1 Tax=Sphingomonas sp. SRS2 TaxID=133190 RepID=UPI0006184E38|nr:hypothetical protein [Sphingomonas sp. SRS2]KKC24612.1 hypothetical protein WP12_18490 [Sphingomonas sp. SRS2]
MRRFLHLLILTAVLCCGVHIGNEAQAREHVAQQLLETQDHDDSGAAPHGAPGNAADGGHHHCPAAPGPRAASIGGAIVVKAILCAAPVAVLYSRSQQPPVEPPSA